MKTLRKFKKNRKALSPVVASIILVAVAVAVSLAVTAWVGALTVGFMGSSSITITNVSFQGTSGTANTIILTMKNTGTKLITIASIKVNNAAVSSLTAWTGNNATMTTGETNKQVTLGGNIAWTTGNPYKIDLYETSGQLVGSYQANS
jgi:flagellin-like protein